MRIVLLCHSISARVPLQIAAANAAETKRQAQWNALKEEQSRRAVLLSEQERSIAKLNSRCRGLEIKNRMLTAKQEEAAQTAAEAFNVVNDQELRNVAGSIYAELISQHTAACSRVCDWQRIRGSPI